MSWGPSWNSKRQQGDNYKTKAGKIERKKEKQLWNREAKSKMKKTARENESDAEREDMYWMQKHMGLERESTKSEKERERERESERAREKTYRESVKM